MSQKFISLDDAAAQLGVSKDRLNQLREAGDLRAYRDGASWKFRTEEIEKLEAEGVPGDDASAEDVPTLSLEDDDLELELDPRPPPPGPRGEPRAGPAGHAQGPGGRAGG
ncbi:MAG: helix-turn-helix domain-containing protein, partial [Planctomycetota bacterium]